MPIAFVCNVLHTSVLEVWLQKRDLCLCRPYHKLRKEMHGVYCHLRTLVTTFFSHEIIIFTFWGDNERPSWYFVLEIVSVKRLTVSVVMNSWRSRCWRTKWWWHHTWGPRKPLRSATGLFELKVHFAGNHTFQAFRMHTASCLSEHRTALKLRFCVKVLLACLIDEIMFDCAGPVQIPWEHPTLHRSKFVARPLCSLGPLVTVKRLVNT